MANPQPDKHTRVSHEWLEPFIAASYPVSIKNFVLAVMRETWGWNETWRAIPVGRFCELLNVDERRVYQVRDDALRHNLIELDTSDVRGSVPQYRVQKDFIEWIEYRPNDRAKQRSTRLKDALHSTAEGRPSAEPLHVAKDALQSTTEGRPSPSTEGRPTGLYKDERQLKTEERQGERAGAQTAPPGLPDLPPVEDLDPSQYAHMEHCNSSFTQAFVKHFSGKPPQWAREYAQECRVQIELPNSGLQLGWVEAQVRGLQGPVAGPMAGAETDLKFGPAKFLERLQRMRGRASPSAQDNRILPPQESFGEARP